MNGVVYIFVAACAAACVAAAFATQETYYGHCEMMPNSKEDDREDNQVYGTVELSQTGNGATELKYNLTGFNTDDDVTLHGFHIHEFGDMSDGCSSMEGHYNPLGLDHGAPTNNPLNRHFGDLGNIEETTGSDAIFSTMFDDLVMLHGDYSVIGRGIVVHAHDDDLGLTGVDDSLTTGNAGNRIACCVISRTDDRHWQNGYEPETGNEDIQDIMSILFNQ